MEWIIDTGVIDHMVNDVSLIHDRMKLSQPFYVGLPDGHVIHVTETGQVLLSRHITLHNVLLVPGFKYNLLSVGRLVDESDFRTIFDKHDCILQCPGCDEILLRGF